MTSDMTVRDREFRRRLGLGLRVLGQARGMTQEEVAARAGFCGRYISARTGLPRDALGIAREIAGLPQRHAG